MTTILENWEKATNRFLNYWFIAEKRREIKLPLKDFIRSLLSAQKKELDEQSQVRYLLSFISSHKKQWEEEAIKRYI